MDVSVIPDLGGGHGYPRVVTESDADTIVTSASDLQSACENASSGEIIFIPGDEVIDFSGYYNIDFGSSNVTLASDRGYRGSDGALIYDTTTNTDHNNSLFKINADGTRVTGLRIRGPEPDQVDLDRSKETGALWFLGDNGEADNCEIYHWHLAAIKLAGSSYPNNYAHVHHNHLHHNRMEGYGYGIEQYDGHALYEFNYFNAHRHDISGFGTDTISYEARYNLVGPICHGHSFDMHNWDENGGTEAMAGKYVNIHHNTWMFYEEIGKFKSGDQEDESAITIRGVPDQQSYIENNWFRHSQLTEPGDEGGPVHQERVDNFTKLGIQNNNYGGTAPSSYAVGAYRPHDVAHLVPKTISD